MSQEEKRKTKESQYEVYGEYSQISVIEDTLRRNLTDRKKFISEISAQNHNSSHRISFFRNSLLRPPETKDSCKKDPSLEKISERSVSVIGPKCQDYENRDSPFQKFKTNLSSDLGSELSMAEKRISNKSSVSSREESDKVHKLISLGNLSRQMESGGKKMKNDIQSQRRASQNAQMLGGLFGGGFFK